MKKILIIKDGLQTGGTTASFLAFLQAMEHQEKYEVYVWINELLKADKRLPQYVHIYSTPELDGAFAHPQSAIGKILRLLKNQQFYPYLKSRFLLKKNRDNRRVIACYQQMDIKKAKSQKKIELSEFDAVLTWEELYPCYLLAECIQTKKRIAWIHPDYVQCGFEPQYDRPVFEKLDAIVAVSKGGQHSLKNAMPELAHKFRCVNNCVNVMKIREKSEEPQQDIIQEEEQITLVTVARLQNISKALDRAVRVSSRLKKAGYCFKWYFVGNGEDYERIQTLIEENDVKDCMVLLGHKDNPYPYMKKADLFVLQSYYEGKPVVVDEAMIIGTPVLVSDYASAKSQVIEGCGWVVDNDEDAIYKGMEEILGNTDKLLECKKHLAKLDVERYMDCSAYVNLFDEVLKDDCEDI